MDKYGGPFYVKTNEGYEFAEMCKECAFGSEEHNFCCLKVCTYLEAVAEAEDNEDG